jgi:hypothetical protein
MSSAVEKESGGSLKRRGRDAELFSTDGGISRLQTIMATARDGCLSTRQGRRTFLSA